MRLGFSNIFRGIAGGLLLSLCACSSGGWRKLSTDEIRTILPELSLLEATAAFRDLPDSLRQSLYTDYFDSRGITQTDWDSTMAWYAKNQMIMYENFYRIASEQVERDKKRLQARKDSIFRAREWELQRRNGQLDSVNLLQDTLLLYGGGDLVNYHFLLRPSLPYNAGTRLRFEFGLYGISSSSDSISDLSVELRAHLSDSTSLLIHQSLSSNTNKAQELSLLIPEGKTASLITGYIRGRLPILDTLETKVLLQGISLVKYTEEVTLEDTEDQLVVAPKDQIEQDDF